MQDGDNDCACVLDDIDEVEIILQLGCRNLMPQTCRN